MSALPALSFGSLLRHHRLAAGLTQEELAERAGVSPRAIVALEGGERRRPYRQTIQRLAAALQLPTRDVEMLERAAGYAPTARDHREGEPYVQVTPLVGRARELAAIERYLGDPGPPVLLLAGEPGIGKSRLLGEAASQARAHGLTVLEGGGHSQSGQAPYAPLLNTLAHSLTSLPLPRLRSALTGCAWLARLLPELMEILSIPMASGTLPAEQERRLVFDAVARYLANVAGPSGTLLVLDDLQWASPDGLDMLTSLLRSGSNPPIRVVGAYRDTDVGQDHPLAAVLAELAERNQAEQLRVQLLADRDAMELLDALLPGQGRSAEDTAVRQQIMRRSGGLPFFLLSCVQGLAADPANMPDRLAVPWSVATSVRRRIAALPPPGQETLRAAAVIGHSIDRRVLLGMGVAPEPEVLAGVDAACRARLLVTAGEHDYRFAHDVIREVLEADLGPGQRMLLHRSAGQALERLPQHSRRASELAWHYQEADDARRALPYTLLAGDQAEAVFAHGEGERHYRRALELAGDVGDAAGEATAGEKLGRVFVITARLREARGMFERAIELYRTTGNQEGETRVTIQLAWLLIDTEDPGEAIARVRPLLSALNTQGPSSVQAEVCLVLAGGFTAVGRFEEALETASRAADIARALGDDRMTAAAEGRRGFALAEMGDPGAQPVLERTITLATTIGDLETLHRAVLDFARNGGDDDAAMAYIRQTLQLVERGNDPLKLATLLEVMIDRGYTEEAREHLERALGAGQEAGMAGSSLYPLLHLHGLVAMTLGDWGASRRDFEETVRLAKLGGYRWARRRALKDLAWQDLWEGRPDQALARLVPEHDDFIEAGMGPVAVLAEVYVQLGDLDRAESVVNESLERHKGETLQGRGMVLRVGGMARARRGHWDEAIRWFEAALLEMRRARIANFEAHILYDYGLMYVEKGDPEYARDRLQAALALFRRIGSRPFIERTERLLSALV